MSSDEYQAIVRAYRNKVRKAKGQVELNLPREVKDNKKLFRKCIGDNRKTEENMGPLLNGAGDLVTQNYRII